MTIARPAVLLIVLLSTPALAEAPQPPAPASGVVAGAVAAVAPARRLYVGVALDVGVPDGAGASLIIQPLAWLRLHAGGAGNGAGGGVHGGIVLVPFHAAVRPTLTLEGGHFFEGDAAPLLALFGVKGPAGSLHVGYDYANARLGLEFGGRRAAFFIDVGASYVDAWLPGLTPAPAAGDTPRPPVHVHYLGPSAKLGLRFFLF